MKTSTSTSKPAEAVINLRFFDPFIITTAEYEKLLSEVTASALVDAPTIGLQILAKLLDTNSYRYHEAKQQNRYRGVTPCGHCGCTDAPISGNDVHPGYDGYPVCPNCKAV